MSEMEMKNDVESEEFTDEMFDETLDWEQGGRACFGAACFFPGSCR